MAGSGGWADGRIGGRTDGKGIETWYGAKGGVVDLFPWCEGEKNKKKHRAHDSGWGVGWLGGCCGVVLKVVDFGAGR